MKALFAVALAVVTFSAGAAYAEGGEGRDQPFPSRASDASVKVVRFGGPNQFLPTTGADGPVQTANSLPVGFANGTQVFEQRQKVLAYMQGDADHRAAVLMAEKDKAAAAHRG